MTKIMENMHYTKLCVLPYDSQNMCDEVNEFNHDAFFSEEIKNGYNIKTSILYKRTDEWSKELSDPFMFFTSSKLHITQNTISDVLNVKNKLTKVLVFLLPGTYYLDKEEINMIDDLKLVGIVDQNGNKPRIIMRGNFIINCNYFRSFDINFEIQNNNYHNDEYLTDAGLIISKNTKEVTMNDCTFSGIPEEKKNVFYIGWKSENIVIENCKFFLSKFRFDGAINSKIKLCEFNDSYLDLYNTTCVVNNNEFKGDTWISIFNSPMTNMLHNHFIDVSAHLNLVRIDYNSHLYFYNNYLKTVKGQYCIFNMDRSSNCCVGFNKFNIKLNQPLANIKWESKFELASNEFNNKKIKLKRTNDSIVMTNNMNIYIVDNNLEDTDTYNEIEFENKAYDFFEILCNVSNNMTLVKTLNDIRDKENNKPNESSAKFRVSVQTELNINENETELNSNENKTELNNNDNILNEIKEVSYKYTSVNFI